MSVVCWMWQFRSEDSSCTADRADHNSKYMGEASLPSIHVDRNGTNTSLRGRVTYSKVGARNHTNTALRWYAGTPSGGQQSQRFGRSNCSSSLGNRGIESTPGSIPQLWQVVRTVSSGATTSPPGVDSKSSAQRGITWLDNQSRAMQKTTGAGCVDECTQLSQLEMKDAGVCWSANTPGGVVFTSIAVGQSTCEVSASGVGSACWGSTSWGGRNRSGQTHVSSAVVASSMASPEHNSSQVFSRAFRSARPIQPLTLPQLPTMQATFALAWQSSASTASNVPGCLVGRWPVCYSRSTVSILFDAPRNLSVCFPRPNTLVAAGGCFDLSCP